MKTILLIISIVYSNLCFCQPEKTKQIDSSVQSILTNRESYFKAGHSNFLYDKDSNVVGDSNIEFYYLDSESKNLVYLDQLSFTRDTASIHFYFAKHELIKIEARYCDAGEVKHGEFYFVNGEHFYSKTSDDNYFKDLIVSPKKYIILNPTKLYTDRVIH